MLRPDASTTDARAGSSPFPSDLLGQAAARLGTLALLYAFTFFMAGVFPMLLFAGDRALLFSDATYWGPPAVALTVALLVAAVARTGRVALPGRRVGD